MGAYQSRWTYLLILLFSIGISACEKNTELAGGQAETARATIQASQAQPSVAGSHGGPTQTSNSTSANEELSRFEIGSLKYLGTNRFANLAARPAANPYARESEFILNFQDADLSEVAQVILGDFLQANYVYDPRVEGRVNLQTTQALSSEAALEALETLLRMNGAALVRDVDLFRVVPWDGVLQAGLVPELGDGGTAIPAGHAVRVVPLNFVSAEQMATLLEPFLPPEGVLRTDTDRNLIVLAGTSREVANLLETVEIFDVDWLAGMSVGIFPLSHVGAATVAEELETIFGGTADGPLAGLIQFLPIKRLNALLVVTGRSEYLEQAELWIERLDRNADTGRNLYVYYVQNGKAADLAAVLTDVFSRSHGRTEGELLGRVAPGLEVVELGETSTAGSANEASGDGEVNPGEAGGAGEPVVRQTSATVSQPRQSEGLYYSESADIRIIADEINNAILILASKDDYRMVEAALLKLDIVPLQVLIEATIAEVELTDELRYGIQWFFQSNDFGLGDAGRGTFSTSGTSELLSTFPGFSFVLAESATTRFVLDSLEDTTTVDVVSSPHLMVLDNQTAELQVGDEVPIVTQQARSITDADSPLVNTVQFRDTGVILRVTPRVSSGGLINMEIEQEVSDVTPTTTSGIDSPTISQRKIKSSVVIRSGETVVLGGLIDDSNTESKSGLPVLSSIPVIGALFGRTEERSERTELIVLISPRVISNEDEARLATEELRERMKGIRSFGRIGKEVPLVEEESP